MVERFWLLFENGLILNSGHNFFFKVYFLLSSVFMNFTMIALVIKTENILSQSGKV